ncbi:MAG TPA: transcription-repair coupling factor, partial [Tissierellaceae bacterium]
IISFSMKSTISYQNKLELLIEDLNHYKKQDYKVIILSGSESRALRLQETLLDYDIESIYSKDRSEELKKGKIYITIGSIQDGIEYSDNKIVVISDKQLFSSPAKKKPRKKSKLGEKIVNIADLEIGSFVVHEDHGIGRYEGIEQLEIQGVKKDYLSIRYKDEDKLYIPVDQMNLIQKYIGSDARSPKVNKLNSGDWQKTKVKAKKAVEDMAKELIELYAKRETYKGYAFQKDTPWQQEFEDQFPYKETDGQLQAIEEIKRDMESTKPMDRLLCGDVGYGKTEVALRAAFKAVMDGKQVVFLVPTTILASQHYETMVERFKDFPIKADMISRFRTPHQQKLILEALKRGSIDIVVGTHRLLSSDVKFKDLGLLIIDEEQRFGVKDKEKIKQIKENVDVLILTATPIPRTLHMSLAGIRDMSVLEEPPAERFPIQTYVVEYNDHMIKDAILKEISRGGQVYFVYNRVATIDRMASKLKKMLPDVEFGVAHGQMSERQLEKEMISFSEKEIDCLVCTTIIETGLDIPSVNTIIIYNADKMGLSQLYQLRGRVGRSNRLAYGYFTYEKDRVLTEVAEKRLKAIKEFTEFGSGFKIAMRDLEIRGAGNLLGLQQHGHIEAIGYDLYVKFLSEAVRRLKGDTIKEEVNTTIDLNIDGYIPDNYIKDSTLKIEMYKKIAIIDSEEYYMDLIDELIDRFGDMPKAVENLIDISYIKYLAGEKNITNISQTKKGIRFDLLLKNRLDPEKINDLSLEYPQLVEFDFSMKPNILYKEKQMNLQKIKEFLIVLQS